MIRLFIADDHPLVRAGFRQVLLCEPDMQIVCEAGTGDEVLEKIRTTLFDVLLLDLNMPGKNGLDLIKEIKHLSPKTHILVVSMFPLERFAVRALKLGAAGYLTKDVALQELPLAVRAIVKRGKYISQELAEILANELGINKETLPHETLSDREFQIFYMLTSGKTIKEIAGTLGLNISTVNTYHTRILEKMNMRTNVELTLYAIANRLIKVQIED